MKKLITLLLMLLIAFLIQGASFADEREEIRMLYRQIELLKKRIEELEKKIEERRKREKQMRKEIEEVKEVKDNRRDKEEIWHPIHTWRGSNILSGSK